MLRGAYDTMLCARCRQPAILTAGAGVCAHCFRTLEHAAARLLEATGLDDDNDLPIDELALARSLETEQAA